MSDKEKNQKELDFVTNPDFQKLVKKAKWKQTVKFFLIGSLATLFILFAIYFSGAYFLQKRIETVTDEYLFSGINGANVQLTSTYYVYHFLSAVAYTNIEKTVGDRSIIWATVEEEIPMFGKRKVVANDQLSAVGSFSERFNRMVQYNRNGEREVEFYYPQVNYDYLPNELEIVTTLDDYMLAEVALSFDKPYTLEEVETLLGRENVNWLWVDTTTEHDVEKETDIPDEYRTPITMDGMSADGFQIYAGGEMKMGAEMFLETLKQLSEEGKYQSTAQKIASAINDAEFPTVDDIRITGAVVSGIPDELERFLNIDIVRASTIGATIDLY